MSGKIYSVSTSEELYDALAVARGGDTIELAPGDFGDLTLNSKSGFDITYDAPVTITSADPGAPASISSMWLDGAENLTFDNVVFDYTYASTDEVWSAPFRIHNGADITIENSVFDGDVASNRNDIDDGYGFAKGLEVTGTQGMTLTDNEFFDWHRGTVMNTSQDILIHGNEMYDIRSDGMDFAAVQGVVIEDNYLHDFKDAPGSPDHEDMIQFWTTGTDTPTTDVTIRNNVLDIGEGSTTQSIFMRNEVVDQGLAGTEMYYQNIVIEENVIRNGHTHGITVGETDGLRIQNNTILAIDPEHEQFHSVPAINLSPSENVTVTHNVVGRISGYDNEPGYVVVSNAFVQNTDPDMPGYYDQLFIESTLYEDGGVGSYVVVPGSMIDNLDAGASRLQLDTTPDSLTPQFDVKSSADAAQSLVFDAGLTYGPAGAVLSEDAIFRWDFGDGHSSGGRVVEHTYEAPGYYTATLEVTHETPQGTVVETVHAEVGVTGDDILSFDAASGQFLGHGYGIETALNTGTEAIVQTSQGMAVDLGGSGSVLQVPKEDMARFFGNDGFEMSMTLEADQPGTSAGEIVRVHGSFVLSAEPDGDLSLEAFSANGDKVEMTTQGVKINDGAAHDIAVRFDGDAGKLEILVDDQVVGSQAMTGPMPGISYHGLSFGDPWGAQGFDGKLHDFELGADASQYSVFEGELEFHEIRDDEGSTVPEINGFVVDFAELPEDQLVGGASVVTEGEETFVQLDSKTEYVGLDRQREFEDSNEIAVAVEFQKANAEDSGMRVAWNRNEIGVVVEEDGLTIHYGQDDTKFRKSSVEIDGLELGDTQVHQVVVLADANADRLQVILDGEVVLDQAQDIDIEFGGDFGRKDIWTLGSKSRFDYNGEIHDFRIEDNAEFVDTDLIPDDATLFG